MKLMKKYSWFFFSEIKAYVSDHCHQKTIFQWNPKCLYINMPVMVQLLKMWLWLVNTYNLIFEISLKKSFSFLRQWAICYNIILHVSWKYSVLQWEYKWWISSFKTDRKCWWAIGITRLGLFVWCKYFYLSIFLFIIASP